MKQLPFPRVARIFFYHVMRRKRSRIESHSFTSGTHSTFSMLIRFLLCRLLGWCDCGPAHPGCHAHLSRESGDMPSFTALQHVKERAASCATS